MNEEFILDEKTQEEIMDEKYFPKEGVTMEESLLIRKLIMAMPEVVNSKYNSSIGKLIHLGLKRESENRIIITEGWIIYQGENRDIIGYITYHNDIIQIEIDVFRLCVQEGPSEFKYNVSFRITKDNNFELLKSEIYDEVVKVK